MPDQLARQRSTTLLFYGLVLLLGYLLYQLFEPFLMPLAWAAIFAAFFYSRHKRLEVRFGKTGAASISTAAVALIIVLAMLVLLSGLVVSFMTTVGNERAASVINNNELKVGKRLCQNRCHGFG